MSLPYQAFGLYTASIQYASFLSAADTSLFFVSQSSDIWFGQSNNDVIEISSFTDDDQTQEGWNVIYQDKTYQTYTSTYLNYLNIPQTYSYSQLVNPYTIYSNQTILLQPSSDLSILGITSSNHIISYNFTRNMAGSVNAPLTIKDISPSRTEIKLIPSTNVNVDIIQYYSYCFQKFTISDVASILLSITQNFPYDEVYSSMSSLNQYQDGIESLQANFFLTTTGDIIQFLKEMYEDTIKYSSFLSPVSTATTQPYTLIRTQGIQTYYNNYILQNYETISDFDDIRNNYISFVNTRILQRFNQFINISNTNTGIEDAIQFCYDYFITYFYDVYITPLQSNYNQKYFDYFKNVLNFGNNEYYPILNNNYIDERISSADPLTLIVKLANSLPTDINIKDTCWVSNFGMNPYIFTATIQNPFLYQIITISGPDFGSPQKLINQESTNVLYSSDDLTESDSISNLIQINKNLTTLNVDYSKYDNFVVFSSIQTRLNIFKNKMIQWTTLNAALTSLNNLYSASLSSSIPYPYYLNESCILNNQINELIYSFDGFESYLFTQGNYTYNLASGSFFSSSYISDADYSASLYDKNNRDSLLANVPQYLIDDTDNSDYLTFLNMIGHHFDNIYTYISAMPIDRHAKNEIQSTLPTNTLKEMLYSFGWDVDDIIADMDIDDVYLNSMSSASYDSLSGQQRLQTIWNRILVTLPAIYKSKGTIECVNYLLSCYGLPSSMLSIREYGGVDYSTSVGPTYILDEKTYMLTFSGVGDYIEGPIPYNIQTIEFKFSLIEDESNTIYPNFKYTPLFTSIPYPYTCSVNFNWSVGFYRVPGENSGQLTFQMGSGSSGAFITSSILPIFNGDIFSVMVRQNNPYYLFDVETTGSYQVPLEYDLTVQRNEHGRTIFYSTSSIILYENDNSIFSQFGRFRLSNGTLQGTLDKLLLWDLPIDDNDFNEHVDDINSYGYSGSVAYQDLWVRLFWDYPQNMYASSSKVWINNASPYYSIPNYYADSTLTTVNPGLYTASLDIINDVWTPYYPTGSTDIIAYNFPQAIGNAFSASFVGYPICAYFSQSVYPYQFEELTYEQNIDASKFGPAPQYQNNKIKTVSYQLDTRLDSKYRSTYEPDISISGESNQLGFFIDPQDSKNKDILRYVGKSGIMELIGDPGNLYKSRYCDLISKNYEYNTNGNKRTYFNELLTVYKFYFDKSIFGAIQNVVPARANTYTGVVVEPTLLERPKYQNRPITASACISYQSTSMARIKNIYHFGENLLWADFNTNFSLVNSDYPSLQTSMSNSLPPNYQQILDFTYISDPIRTWPVNVENNVYNDYPDIIQHNFYPDFEKFPRLWETTSPCVPANSAYTTPIYGSVSHTTGLINGTNPGRLIIGTSSYINYPDQYYFPGVNTGSHQILYYMLKVWEPFYYYTKTGEYVRSTNPNGKPHSTYNFEYNGQYYYATDPTGSLIIRDDDPSTNEYTSASYSLYKYVIVNEYYMRDILYFTNGIYLNNYNPNDVASTPINFSLNPPFGAYTHMVNTFINTPDQKVNNVYAYNVSNSPFFYNLGIRPGSYFELAKGYPRNHYTHKAQQFSKIKYNTINNVLFIKGQNSDPDAFTSTITNTNTVVYTSPVILSVPSANVGTIVQSSATSATPSTPSTPSTTTTTTSTSNSASQFITVPGIIASNSPAGIAYLNSRIQNILSHSFNTLTGKEASIAKATISESLQLEHQRNAIFGTFTESIAQYSASQAVSANSSGARATAQYLASHPRATVGNPGSAPGTI